MNTTVPTPKDLVSLRIAAARLDLSTRAVYRLVARGILPRPVKVGGASKFFADDIDAYLDSLRAGRANAV